MFSRRRNVQVIMLCWWDIQGCLHCLHFERLTRLWVAGINTLAFDRPQLLSEQLGGAIRVTFSTTDEVNWYSQD
jgi:hypothetical protein